MGLKQLGLKHGDRLALMGDPCEEYMISELAAQALGALTYGIYPTSSQKEVRYLMNDGGASIFVAENQEYVDRILPLHEELPRLKHIIVIDTKGTFMYEIPSLKNVQECLINGDFILKHAAPIFTYGVTEEPAWEKPGKVVEK